MKIKKRVNFEVEISELEKLNNEFSLALIKIMYADENRNGSFFAKDIIVSKLIPSIYNIPVVGHFIEGKKDFGGHDSVIELNSNGEVNFKDLTVPFGVVPESTKISWEETREENGQIREYLTCTAIIWTGRYPEQTERIFEQGNNQSMEVSVYDGFVDEQDGLYHVLDAEFSALCILGQDVEPCFESAKIQAYSLNEFTKEFKLMMKEFNNSFSLSNHQINTSELVQKAKKEGVSGKALGAVKKYIKENILEGGKQDMEDEKKEEMEVKPETENKEVEATIETEKKDEPEKVEAEAVKEVVEKNSCGGDKEKMEEDEDDDDDFEKEKMENEKAPLLSDLKAELRAKEDMILMINKNYSNLEESSSKIISEKDKEITELKAQLSKYQEAEIEAKKLERKAKVDELFSTAVSVLSLEEIEAFKKEESSCEDFEKFDNKVRAYMFNKLNEKHSKEKSNLSKDNFTFIPLTTIIEEVKEEESSNVWDRLQKNK